MIANSVQETSFFTSRLTRNVAIILLLVLGLAIRLYDLTDLPLDFHPTRQLLSALKARGMYYQTLTNAPAEQREFAIQQWKFRALVEPEFLERIVAFTYQFTGEKVWVGRIYSSLFWVTGGIFLYLLARDLTSTEGALASLAFYLFLPYSVIASRSFQPDPLMVMLIIIFWWAMMKWASLAIGGRVGGDDLIPSANNSTSAAVHLHRAAFGAVQVSRPQSWFFAILAGLSGGFAIFIKFVAAFFVIGGGLGAVFGRESLRETVRRPQVYVMSVLGLLPGAAYLVYGLWIAGYLGQQFGGRFIPSLFLSPSYYLGWVSMLNLVVGAAPLMLGLLGLFFFEKEKLRFLLGLWVGYALFGLTFNYHISSHDYYSLPLIPIVALSLAPLVDLLFAKLSELTASSRTRLAAFCLMLLGLFASFWNLRADLKSIDYRPEAAMWAKIGEQVDDSSLAGLTQDYGSRLAYWGWKNLTAWPTSGDLIYHEDLRGSQRDFEKKFAEISRKDLFLVTDFDELNRQPLLKEKLATFQIFAQGEGYIIYDLHQPITMMSPLPSVVE